jgi:hypothetical protein
MRCENQHQYIFVQLQRRPRITLLRVFKVKRGEYAIYASLLNLLDGRAHIDLDAYQSSQPAGLMMLRCLQIWHLGRLGHCLS